MPINVGNQGTNLPQAEIDWKKIARQFTPVIDKYIQVFNSLDNADRTQILTNVNTVLNAYDPLTASATNNTLFAGIMIGVLLAKREIGD